MYLICITWTDGAHDSAVVDSPVVALLYTRWENAKHAEIWSRSGQEYSLLLHF